MMRARVVIAVLGLAVPSLAAAQAGTTAARSGVVFESYSFGSGLAFTRISELTIPITLTQRIGSRFAFDIGTAFASASVEQSNGKTLDHSGLLAPDLAPPTSALPARPPFHLAARAP